jgi:hypothetical protein
MPPTLFTETSSSKTLVLTTMARYVVFCLFFCFLRLYVQRRFDRTDGRTRAHTHEYAHSTNTQTQTRTHMFLSFLLFLPPLPTHDQQIKLLDFGLTGDIRGKDALETQCGTMCDHPPTIHPPPATIHPPPATFRPPSTVHHPPHVIRDINTLDEFFKLLRSSCPPLVSSTLCAMNGCTRPLSSLSSEL